MRKERGVSKVPQPGCIVRHGVGGSWDVIGLMEKTVVALVKCLKAE